MAEEEQSFTFVDKRHVQSDTAASDTVAAEPAQATQVADPEFDAAETAGEPDGDAQGSPDVYSVVGYCMNILTAEAWQKLGLLADPQTGETNADLAQAKVAIDAVGSLAGLLDGASENYFPATARRDVRSLVNDLRLNYVAQRDRSSVA